MSLQIASKAVVGKVLDGEVVIINLESGYYYSSEGIGAAIWEMIEHSMSRTGILGAVEARYTGETVDAAKIGAFLDSLVQFGLVRETDEAGSASAPEIASWPESYADPEILAYDDVADMVALDPPLPEMNFER